MIVAGTLWRNHWPYPQRSNLDLTHNRSSPKPPTSTHPIFLTNEEVEFFSDNATTMLELYRTLAQRFGNHITRSVSLDAVQGEYMTTISLSPQGRFSIDGKTVALKR
jgi:hypothetical protein